MKRRIFFKNTFAISVMYDAVLFVVMVSLSGVVLIPALQNDIAVESSIKKHQEHTADEALNSLLVSRVDKFSYDLGGNVIHSIVGDLFEGNDIYNSLSSWLLGHEQLHKTYANLIADDLGCQFSVFTGEFDTNLKDNIKGFLSDYLGDRFNFKFTAIWRPVNGIKMGELVSGDDPPEVDCYVSKTNIVMPFNSTESFENAAGISASDSDLLTIQRAEVRLVIWEVRG